MSDELIINHNAGFFSCCSIRLFQLIDFFNNKKKLPTRIDASKQFSFYKQNPFDENEDLNFLFFKHYNHVEETIEYIDNINYTWDDQFIPYKNIDIQKINFFIRKYFTLSDFIKNIITETEKKYEIDYENTISVCYRGNDKWRETKIAKYEDFFIKCDELNKKNQNCKFFLQTDELEFLKEFYKNFPNTFHLQEIPVIHKNKDGVVHYTINPSNKPTFACDILKSIYMLSKSKHVITHSGNCGIWIYLFRNNVENFHQYLNHNNNFSGWI
jgi:hypothetical protein